MTVIGALSPFRKRREMSHPTRASQKWHRPNQEPLMRRHACRHGKAASEAASIQDSLDSLLTPNEEGRAQLP